MTATALRDGPARPPAGAPGWLAGSAGADVVRYPLLAEAMTEVARALAEGLDTLSASPGVVSFEGLRSGKLEAQFAGRRGTVLAIAQAPAWKTPIGLQFDHDLVSAVVEALFGGAGEGTDAPERDSLSPIEARIADVIAEQAAQALTAGFADVLPTDFALEPIRPKLDPGLLGKPSLPVLVATLVLHGVAGPAELHVLIPEPALRPFRDRLIGNPDPPAASPDPDWSERLEAEVGLATMRLQASIDLPASLGEIARFRTGHVLTLPSGAGNKVGLRCAGNTLFRCELGQSGGYYTVRIEEPVAHASSPPRKDR